MEPLDHPESFHLRAAQGWFELGNCAEASAELERLGKSGSQHPAVLELRWQIAVKNRLWEEGLAIAETLCQAAPESSFGGIHRAYCLHELKRTKEAWDILLPLAEKFPEEWLICYNLACYACQLGQLTEARAWLMRAIERGDPREINRLAAEDPDLKPLSKPG